MRKTALISAHGWSEHPELADFLIAYTRIKWQLKRFLNA